jgi:hypothetical protein
MGMGSSLSLRRALLDSFNPQTQFFSPRLGDKEGELMNYDLQYAVKWVATLEEMLRQSIWAEVERVRLGVELKLTQSAVRIVKANLIADGFSEATVNDLERQFIAEFMEGKPS